MFFNPYLPNWLGMSNEHFFNSAEDNCVRHILLMQTELPYSHPFLNYSWFHSSFFIFVFHLVETKPSKLDDRIFDQLHDLFAERDGYW